MDAMGFKTGAAFRLSKNVYKIFVHDPGYFFPYVKPKQYPGIVQEYRTTSKFDINWISVTENILMNTKENKCEEDESYNFNVCVRNSVSRKFGCKLAWDFEVTEKLSNCTEISTVKEILSMYRKVELRNIDRTVLDTSCALPCRYNEYVLEAEDSTEESSHGISFWFLSQKVLVKKERLLYEMLSFFADIAGSLGIFLGVSLLTLWDTSLSILKSIQKSSCTQTCL